MNTGEKHTFVICAYKKSNYLEKCIQSLKNQTVKSQIIMITSTPNEFISNLAQKYSIPLYINEGQGGIVQDWNFGYHLATTTYITLAHQDDVSFENYTEEMLRCMAKKKRPLIYFTNYAEIRNGVKVTQNQLLNIKRFMLSPLQVRFFQNSRFVRRRILSLGCPICCPSVTFVRNNLPETVFQTGFRSCEDWEAWEMLSRVKGSFIYNKRILMGHRIHEDSETSHIIQDNERVKEDFVMYCKFWPKWLAKILVKLYSSGEKSNEL